MRTKGGRKPHDAKNSQSTGRPPDILALKPDWGKPTVRNFRGSGGNVGIIRSPVRATALPGVMSNRDPYSDFLWMVRPESPSVEARSPGIQPMWISAGAAPNFLWVCFL